ncbi:MAG: sigma 54-interacting transcriptional regulator, partial [Smithellaceae bacterium]
MDQKKYSFESLQDYESLLNEIQDGVGETDLEGNLTFINDAGCRIWGYSREEIIGSNYTSYTDEESARFLLSAYNDVYRTGTPGRFVHVVIRKDGARRIVEDSVSLIRKEGRIVGFRAVQRDVTEREEAKQRLDSHQRLLEAVYRSVKDAIVTVDLDLKVIGANQSTETICGLDISRITGRPFFECLSRCNRTCAEVLAQTLRQKMAIAEYRVECGHQDRALQLVSVSSSPLLDREGNFTGAVLVIRDITLLSDLERELRERHKFQNLIGHSSRMQDIYRLLEDLANLETTVLVTGESGTGKELVARALHYSGHRAFRPFVSVNCSALAESLLESELFGHVRGAFTGAVKDKQGRFELAEGGTILLDEIGDISP